MWPMPPEAVLAATTAALAFPLGLSLGYLAEEPYAGALHRRTAWLVATVSAVAVVLTFTRLLVMVTS